MGRKEFVLVSLVSGEHGAIAQGMMQPVAQQAAAHAGGAAVEQAVQRGRGRAAQGFGEFQVAPRRRIHAHVIVRALRQQRVHMGQGLALGFARIVEQRAGRGYA